jgi:prevent-host-death family protein
MTIFELDEAKAHLSELIDRVQTGEIIQITRDGKVVAELTAAKPARKPISLAELRAETDRQPCQSESAGEFVRRMRDEDRY